MTMLSTALRANRLSRIYGHGAAAVRALDDVTLEVAAGSFMAVTGPSGSGKSTLLHCLGGLDTVDSGAVHVADIELTKLREPALTKLRRDQIGMVFQSFNLLPMLSAEENIPLRLAGRVPDRAWLDRLVGVLGLGDRLRHRPSQMSGGQQQRVAIARALVSRPAVVLADEPTGNLDSVSGRDLLGILRRSVDELGQTVVMVTHDPAAAGYADRVIPLQDGRLVGDQHG